MRRSQKRRPLKPRLFSKVVFAYSVLKLADQDIVELPEPDIPHPP